MNLTIDSWIPAVRPDGARALFSLQTLFAEAHQIRDLAVKPHERVALMRLLVCITQAALEGPRDQDDWTDCERLIQQRVGAYLDKWEPAFELFGKEQRFLQLNGLKPGKEADEGSCATKLDLTLASGNNSTLFDNNAGGVTSVASTRAALNLLTFQCFSPGGRIGVAKWNGQDTAGKGSSNHAPCSPSSMIHSLLIGGTLLETIRLNLVPLDTITDNYPSGFGRPVWERPITSAQDNDAIRNATTTYLGRLVPMSRAIRVHEDGSHVLVANGFDYRIFPAFREATATIIRRKDELALLPASLSRSIWRQLSAITVRRKSEADQASGPLALRNPIPSSDVTLWSGAFVTDKAKIEDTVEAVYTLPSSMLSDFGRAAYEKGVEYAERQEGALIQALKTYAESLKVDSPAYDRARQHYWTFVEQQLSALFEVARNLVSEEELPTSGWGRAIKQAAMEAYERCCSRQTPRQIEAYAIGLRKLYIHRKPATTTAQN